MLARMICDPPLGQPTIIPAGQDFVDFVVVLEVAGDASASKQWQVALWHDLNPDGSGWLASELDERTEGHHIVRHDLCIAQTLASMFMKTHTDDKLIS
jgi:hypothetical protein